MNGLIEFVNNSLHMSNLIFDCSLGKQPKAKALEHHWRQELSNREKQIKEGKNLKWDTFWYFLVKPHI